MNNPVDVLAHEHDVIRQVEDVVKSLNGTWNTDSTGYRHKAQQILKFLKEYSDGYHHHKEEKVLFPVISEHPDFHLQGILDELLEHHENFREYATDIAGALQAEKHGDAQKAMELYTQQLLDHIAIENDELFIMAENLFDRRELEDIFFRFADIDRELGLDRKEALEKIPSELM